MALNIFVIKKWAALLILGYLPAFTYGIMLFFFGNFWYALGGLFLSLLIGILLAIKLIHNPFTSMLEGSGLLVIDMNSTGILNFFIMKLATPFVKGFFAGRKIEDVFDRNTVAQIAEPVKISKPASIEKIGEREILKIEIDKQEFNTFRFGMFNYPVLIYNSQLDSLLTKDFFMEKEKQAYSEHNILYLNRKVQELSTILRDFGRYVVEMLKPKTSILSSWWFWLIMIAVLIMIGALFVPKIVAMFQDKTTGISEALASGETVIRR